MTNNTLHNKYLYKLFISIVKYIPIVLAIIKITTLILNSLHIKTFIFTCLGGTSLITLILLYLISLIFKFCGIHRLSLNYITLIQIITIIDYYIGIPITNECLYRLYTVISGLFIITGICVWYKNRNNPKIDYIKRLCDNYADCGC